MNRRTLRVEVAGLHAELTVAKRDLARVRGERDELRRALNVDFRSIARQEVEAALAANTGRRERMVPTVALAAHLNDPEPVRNEAGTVIGWQG